MQRVLDVRILRWYFKLLYVAGAWFVGYPFLWLLELLRAPGVVWNLVNFVLTICGILLGARLFRGRDEELAPPRPWWKMTARPRLSGALGIIAVVLAASSIVIFVIAAFGVQRAVDSLARQTIPGAVIVAILYATIAFLYLNSAVRLRTVHLGKVPARPAHDREPPPRSTAAIVQEVLHVLNQYDLSGVHPGVEGGTPIDEYQNESLTVAGALLTHGSVNRSDISAIWLKWFSDDLDHLSATTWAELLRDLNAIVDARR